MARTKQCSVCKEIKLLSKFYKRKTDTKDGYRMECKACSKAVATKYNNTPRGRRLKWKRELRYKYGISFEQYTEMLLEQRGICAICGKPETCMGNNGEVKTLSVDYDHVTNKVRGLLCDYCNKMLGFSEDNPDNLIKGAKYLEEYK